MQLTPKALIEMLNKICICLIALTTPISAYSGVTEIKQIEPIAISESELLAIGAISAIDTEKMTLELNGQTFVVDPVTETIPSDASGPLKGPAGLLALAPGEYVAVAGEMMDPGKSLATTIVKFKELYVDGASQAFVRVEVDGVLEETGYVTSGKSVIDYTAALYEYSIAEVEPAAIAEFYGTTFQGAFIATEGRIVDIDDENEIGQTQNDSGIRAGRGSGIRAGRGSGIRAGRGSGIRAGRGSGIRAGRGSGIRAGRGSGIRAGRGSGIRAGRGSGIRAGRGSGIRAGRGSGIRAGRGSGIRAGRGSGIRAGRGSGIRAGRGSGIRAGRGSGIRAGRGSGIRAGRGSGIRAGRGSGIRAGRGSGIRAGRGSGIR